MRTASDPSSDDPTRPKIVDQGYNLHLQQQQQQNMYHPDNLHLQQQQQQQNMYHPQPQAYPYPYPYTSQSFHAAAGNYPINSAVQNPYPGYYINNNNNNYHQYPYNIPGEINRPPDGAFTASFGRTMMILMIVLVAAMCMMSLAMWFLYGAYIPEFQVSSLKVSNFTATNTTLTGTWSADVLVYNPNEELAVDFDRVRSLVFYQGVVVGASSVDPFRVEDNMRFEMNFTVAAAADEQSAVNSSNLNGWILPALARDWRNGAVVFSLRIALDAKVSSLNQVYRQDGLRVSCENLEVSFSSADLDEGILSQGLGAECLIRVRDSLG